MDPNDNVAFVSYDAKSLKIIGVFWKNPPEPFVKISKDMAISFMEGTARMHLYRVVVDNDPATIEMIEDLPVPLESWTFSSNSKGISVSDDEHGLKISSVHGDLNRLGLFITLKNDPSWLIRSYNLDILLKDQDTVYVPWPGPGNYSYHVGEIDEISDD